MIWQMKQFFFYCIHYMCPNFGSEKGFKENVLKIGWFKNKKKQRFNNLRKTVSVDSGKFSE